MRFTVCTMVVQRGPGLVSVRGLFSNVFGLRCVDAIASCLYRKEYEVLAGLVCASAPCACVSLERRSSAGECLLGASPCTNDIGFGTTVRTVVTGKSRRGGVQEARAGYRAAGMTGTACR